MTDQNSIPPIGMLEGTIEKAYIAIKEIPIKEIPNKYGMGLYIGGGEGGGDNQNEL